MWRNHQRVKFVDLSSYQHRILPSGFRFGDDGMKGCDSMLGQSVVKPSTEGRVIRPTKAYNLGLLRLVKRFRDALPLHIWQALTGPIDFSKPVLRKLRN